MLDDDIAPEARVMVDLATVSAGTLTPFIGQTFAVADVAPALSLTLTAVEPLPSSAGPGRDEPFALLFSGPLRPRQSQGVYALEHPRLGRLEMFLVPIAPDAQGARYEAVFS